MPRAIGDFLILRSHVPIVRTAARMLRHAAILTILLAAFWFLARRQVLYGPFGYDEADYMFAVSRGIAANAFDSPTLPFPQFLRTGLARGKDPSRRNELSEIIRGSGDVVFYRHWHGPLYDYWLDLARHFTRSEQSLRACNYVFAIATALLIYLGSFWLLPGPAGRFAAILGAVLWLWSFPVVNGAELAPHAMFAMWVVCALFCVARSGQGRRYWYLSVAAAALAFCTLEVALALIATLVIYAYLVRDRLKPSVSFAAKSVAVFLGVVAVFWPGAIFKLSFVKAYLFMAYLAVFRKGAWGSSVGVAGTWWLRFITNPVPWILLAIALVLLIARRRQIWSPLLLAPGIFCVVMFLAILKVNTETPRYILPLYPGIVLLTAFTLGLWLARYKAKLGDAAVILICFAMFAASFQQLVRHRPRPNPNAFALVDLLRAKDGGRKKLLVPHGDVPLIHYYFPGARLTSYLNKSDIGPALELDGVDAVVYDGDPPRYAPVH